MSRLYVDRISPYQSGSLTIDGFQPSIDTGSFATTGSNTFTGKQTVNDYVEQNFAAPTTNQEKAFANISGASVNGKSYNRVYFGIADYPSFGNQFEDYFGIEYYDSLSYNFGSEFNVNGKQIQLQTLASGSGNTSYVRTVDNYNGTSNVAIGSADKISLSGPVESNNHITQNFSAPTTNQEKAFTNVTGATISGKSYNRVYFGIADYPGFGAGFEDYFAIEYYDSLSYNFGSEFNINGKNTLLTTSPSGSGFSGRAYIQTVDNYDGTADVNIASNSGRVNIQSVMRLSAQDPLPAGALGDLAVSGSDLYFHNGTSWIQK